MKRQPVGIYQFPEHARHWFCWRGADSGIYAYLCEDCVAFYPEARLVATDSYFRCDVCNDYGYSDDDWQLDDEDDDGKVG